MKKILLIATAFFLFQSCNRPSDCVESSGALTSKEFDFTAFDRIIVYTGISVVINQGPEYKVEVRTGANLIDGIEVTQSGDMLTLRDNTSCNWVRQYGETTIYITAPNLTEIYSKTEKNITSGGILSFPSLRLVSMDNYDGFGGAGTGDYIMQVNNSSLSIDSNNVSRFTISGQTNQFNINIYEANGILDTGNLVANNIHIYHRGSNNMTVHPTNSISGDIYNIGNVISVTRPPIANVIEHYHGRLIYN
jgi:hypothetical protein